GWPQPGGGPATVRTGLAHLSTLLPSPRRALPAGPCGVAVAGGRVPTSAWMLNLPILTSGGSQGAPAPPHHEIREHVHWFSRPRTAPFPRHPVGGYTRARVPAPAPH